MLAQQQHWPADRGQGRREQSSQARARRARCLPIRHPCPDRASLNQSGLPLLSVRGHAQACGERKAASCRFGGVSPIVIDRRELASRVGRR
jgi:hypothetical protein